MSALSWTKKIDEALLSLDEKPQFGLPQPFPLEAVQAAIEKLFGKKKITLKSHEKGWQTPEHHLQGLGGHLLCITIDMTPLESSLFFVMSQQDLKELMGDFLGGDPSQAPFYDLFIAEGFYQYLALEVMQAVEQVGFAKPLSPRLAESPQDLKAHLKSTPCFVVDISCELPGKNIWGRLLVPDAFRLAWKKYFSQKVSVDPKFPVEIGVQVGRSELSVDELHQVRKGDIILLDHCSIEVSSKKGAATVILGERPIFRGKFKEDGFELLEFPFEELGENMDEDEEFEEESEESSQEGASSKMDVKGLPINLTVEVARLRMTLAELSALSAGSLLDLGQAPKEGVTLLVNGKKVGRGELVQIGEAVGVRVVSI